MALPLLVQLPGVVPEVTEVSVVTEETPDVVHSPLSVTDPFRVLKLGTILTSTSHSFLVPSISTLVAPSSPRSRRSLPHDTGSPQGRRVGLRTDEGFSGGLVQGRDRRLLISLLYFLPLLLLL